MGRRHYHKKKPPSKHYRFNQQIKAPEVKLIDADGEFLGVMSTALALRKAEEQGLDLIEISPKDNPPIAKIIDFGKFKYEQEKKKQKSTPRKIETKSIRLNLNMASHDLETRENQTRKFLELNCRAQMEMSLKGREKIHSKRALRKKTGQSHFNTKESGKTVMGKRRLIAAPESLKKIKF